MNDTFAAYKLDETILSALSVLKYKEPTEIQSKVLPYALEGKDIAAKSQTGSGKTAAFAIPLCQTADWEQNEPGALVLEPTRELVVQVREEIFHIGRNKRLKVCDVFGGFPIDKQILSLKQKNHIVVGTPGRVLDHIGRESLKLTNIKTLVIDEADLMLDMGFIGDVEKILKALPKCQVMLFSATLGEGLEKLVEQYMEDPVTVCIESGTKTVKEINQSLILVKGQQTDEKAKYGREESGESGSAKYQAFLRTLITENPDSCMIFCGTREMVNVLCRKLSRDGVKCGMIHGEIGQQDRLRTIEGFRQGRFRYLIATDVAARGIDFQNLSHVFNYDFPTGKESYVHRIGRTGRNGEFGRAISFAADSDMKMLEAVEKYMDASIPVMEVPEPDEETKKKFFVRQNEKVKLKAGKGADFKKTITKLTISGGKKSKMRAVDIVGTICNIDGVTADDIGVIDVRESLTYVDILNGKGKQVLNALQERTIKGKVRKVRQTR